MKNINLIYLLEEIRLQELKASDMAKAWEGDDPFDAAECDPSDQYIQGEKIETLHREFFVELVSNLNLSQINDLEKIISSRDLK